MWIPADRSGTWQISLRLPEGTERARCAAALPTDPTALLAAMRRASYHGRDADTFVTGELFIGSGWVEPGVVANVVAALKLIPGVQVRQGVDNGAGVRGEAISYSGRIKATVLEHFTVIVDPQTDRVIGTRHSYAGGSDHSTLAYRQVDALGDTR